jgi:hypothetical protein
MKALRFLKAGIMPERCWQAMRYNSKLLDCLFNGQSGKTGVHSMRRLVMCQIVGVWSFNPHDI